MSVNHHTTLYFFSHLSLHSTTTSQVIAATSADMRSAGWNALMFPLAVSAAGMFVCFLASFMATWIRPVKNKHDVEFTLKLQLIITSLAVVVVVTFLAGMMLPEEFILKGVAMVRTYMCACLLSFCAPAAFSCAFIISSMFAPLVFKHERHPQNATCILTTYIPTHSILFYSIPPPPR